MNRLDSVAATLAPDPLRFEHGMEADASSWPRRRRELARAIVPHEYGGMPPAPDGVEVIRRSANLVAPEREGRPITSTRSGRASRAARSASR